MKTKKVIILGSTGSIGMNTVDVISSIDGYNIAGIAFFSNLSEALKQIHRFNIKNVSVFDEVKRKELKKLLPPSVKLFPPGIEGLCCIVEEVEADILMLAISGTVGIFPLFSAIGRIPRICIANKEPVVIAGEIIKKEADKKKTEIIPVDSEPSAIFQVLGGLNNILYLKKIYLTASGGPFYNYKGDFSKITPSQAIKHPRWRMGKKISVDSATLMNKGLEAIEIKNLFGIDISKIEIVIHPQSIIHSAVEFNDGSVIAQMSYPDMRIPIQYSLTCPERKLSYSKKLNLFDIQRLEFFKPDFEKFPAPKMAFDAAKKGGLYPAVLNASNEMAVEIFLKGFIKFNEILTIVDRVLSMWNPKKRNGEIGLSDIVEADEWARNKVKEIANFMIKERR